MRTIQLIEDNAGHLFAGYPGTWFDVTGGKPGTFADDAAAIAKGDTQDWNLEWYVVVPVGEIVAEWYGDGELSLIEDAYSGCTLAGLAAENYIGEVNVKESER